MISLEFLPYYKLSGLSSEEKIRLILQSVKENKIVLIQGRLSHEDEAELIKQTMENIDENFRGIEPAVFYPQIQKEGSFFKYLKEKIISMFLSDRQGLTLIGPSNVIKEIKQDPDKLQLYLDLNLLEKQKKRKKRGNK